MARSRRRIPDNIEKRLVTVRKSQSKEKIAILEALRKIPIVRAAVAKAGVSPSTFYRFKAEDIEFANDADDALSEGVQAINDLAESKVLAGIQNGDKTFVIYWLKNRHPAYTDKVQHQHEYRITEERVQEIALAVKRWSKALTQAKSTKAP